MSQTSTYIYDAPHVSATTQYVHDELDVNEDQIRLVRIEPDADGRPNHILATFNHASCPSYEAVSYAWGNLDVSLDILLNGQSYSVSRNLWSFLRHFSSPDIRIHKSGHEPYTPLDRQGWLWIDQICINQSSNLERNHQVKKMSAIFELARRVIVWLGSKSSYSDRAIQILSLPFGHDTCEYLGCTRKTRFMGERSTSQTGSRPRGQNTAVFIPTDHPINKDHHLCLHRRGNSSRVESLRCVFERPYWNRLWTVQEFILAKDLVLLCGHQGVTWDCLERFYDSHGAAMFDLRAARKYGEHFESCLGSATEHIRMRKHAASTANATGTAPRLSLTLALKRFGNLQCADTRDRVYALLGIVRDDQQLTVDYRQTPRAVFVDAMLLIGRTSHTSPEPLWPDIEDIGRKMGVADGDLAYCSILIYGSLSQMSRMPSLAQCQAVFDILQSMEGSTHHSTSNVSCEVMEFLQMPFVRETMLLHLKQGPLVEGHWMYELIMSI